MNFANINDENIDLYCIKNYSNPQCISIEDYNNDMRRFKYIKRLLNQYANGNEIKIRLLVNHIIMIYNIFDRLSATRILFYKLPQEHWSVLKTILIFLNRMPKIVYGINNTNLISSDIQIDDVIANQLREI
tara:strand:+ start:278 stop:670 length:393 start_codon:yes stop_codon:yes gene_type:complete